ncbi:MAG: hypothetical protein ACXVAX_09550 [Pseudobdellovibrio sp.]
MKILVVLSLFCVLGVKAEAETASKTKTVEQRLLELEREQKEFNQWYYDYYVQSKDRMAPFLGEKISFGGFFETGVTHLSGPDTPAQVSANSNALGINVAADFNEQFHFVSQYLTGLSYPLVNQNNNPNLAPSQREYEGVSVFTIVAQAYLEYRASQAFAIQSGLGYAPFGQAFQQREPVLFRRRGGPQMVDTTDQNIVGIAFPLWQGLHILGSVDLPHGRWGYDFYSFSPSSNPKTLGGGTRLWWADSQTTTIGVSLQSADQGQSSYYSYGYDVDVKINKFGVTAEFARSVQSGGAQALVSYYVEPYYEISDGKWLVYAVADYINNRDHVVGTIADPYEVMEFGGGVNWLPIPNARIRLGVLNHDYWGSTDTINGQRRDYVSLDLSTGIAF